jgi:sRNA-binding regulator protein Hfq
MSNQRHGQPPPSKPNPQAGIRSAPDLREFIERFDALEKIVRENFDEKNQWNSKVREWIGKAVVVRLTTSAAVQGVLQWMDRYTICVQEETFPDVTIVHKGAVATINCLPE